jgi:hypothetical protein
MTGCGGGSQLERVGWCLVQRAGDRVLHAVYGVSRGLTGWNDLTGTRALNLRVVGLVLKDPICRQPVFVARRVEQVN